MADTGVVPPQVVIRSSSGWSALRLAELWEYRELLYFLTLRDVKVRYKQTILGVAWAIIQPLLSMVVFTVFFGRLARMPSDGLPYPLFSYAGMLLWTYFGNAVAAAGNSLVGNSQLITKVYFPRAVIPASAALANLVDYVVALVVLVGLLLWYGIPPGPSLVWFLPMTILTFVLALGVGLWVSALNVLYRDVRHALPFVIQLWMFATPIVYPLSVVPPDWHWVVALNPMAGLVEGFRASVSGAPVTWSVVAISGSLACASLVTGTLYFRRMERSFADVV